MKKNDINSEIIKTFSKKIKNYDIINSGKK